MSETRDYELGPYICGNPHHALLHHVLGGGGPHYGMEEQPIMRDGIALEFGVGNGDSLRCISRYLPVIGFDSFEGLPEDWRPGFDKGSFAYNFNEVLSNVPGNCTLCPGWFEDTLPDWFGHPDIFQAIRLVHIDCDLYSSTKTVLEHVMPVLIHQYRYTPEHPRPVIIFDEWHGYPGCDQHEQRAWGEYVEETDIDWEVIGHGVQQWAVRIK